MTNVKRRADSEAVRLRRMYIDCRFGQLHLTTAYPPNGGFDECTPLMFLHADGGTGADFNSCAVLLGVDRSVYSPDLPGNGASDPGDGRATIAVQVGAIEDLLDQLRLREVDVIGIGRGAAIAVQLAAARPKAVRRLVLAGPPASAAPAQPVLQLGMDPARLAQGAAAPLVAEIRGFLDRV